jgi:hypothetical protein
VQVGRAEETYASNYTCTKCHGLFSAHIHTDPSRPGEYAPPLSFCPVCGEKFSGEIPQSEEGERHRELRGQADWKSHEAEKARRITYTIQSLSHHPTEWMDNTHWMFSKAESPKEAVAMWRDRLVSGSIFGEEVRLVARTPRGERVVFGPVHLEPDTWKRGYR